MQNIEVVDVVHNLQPYTQQRSALSKQKWIIMKKYGLIFFLFFGIAIISQAQKEILFSVNNSDKLLLSAITESSRKISFEPYHSQKLHTIRQLIEVDSFFYISELSRGENEVIERVLQYNNKGIFIRIIEESAKFPFDITQREGDAIYCYQLNDIACYNHDGRLLYSFKSNVKPQRLCFFNNRLWYFSVKADDEFLYYSLFSSDATGQDFKAEMEFKQPYFGDNMNWKYGHFAIDDNTLYFSLGLENSNTMYRLEKGKVLPYVCFTIQDVSTKRLNSILTPPFKKVGNYIFYGYNIDRISGSAVYDIANTKCLSINYKHRGNVLVSGIKDDVYNTGYFEPNLYTNNNSLFFYKKSDNTSDKSTTVYLAKLK